MNESDKRNVSKMAKNTLISGLGTAINYATLPLTSVITTRVLGAELFGIYSLVQSWGALLSNISSLGFTGTILRFIPAYKGLGENYKIKGAILWTLRVSFFVSLIITAFILLFPSQFCDLFVHRPDNISQEKFDSNVVNAFRFYAVSIVMTSFYLVFTSSLNGLQEIKYKVLSNEILGSAAKIISLIVFIFFGLDLYAALGSNLVQDAVILSVSLFFLLKVFPELKNPKFKPEYEKKKMNKFAAALFTNSLLSKYTFQLDILFLGFFQSARDVGIYTVALRLQPLIYLPHYTIMTIFGPLVAELHSQNKMEELKRLYQTVTKWSFSFSLPIFSMIVLFSNEILNIFGKDFSEGVIIIFLLSVGNLVHDLLGLSGNVIMMTGRINVNLINSAVMAVVNVVLYYFLIKFYGIAGAAIGNGLSVIIMNLITIVEVRYFLGFTPFTRLLLKPVMSMLISAGLIEFILFIYKMPFYKFTFVIYVIFMWVFYIIGLFVLKFDEQDRFIIKKISSRFSFISRLLPKSYR